MSRIVKPPRMNLYRAYRQLERLLFSGVPERPESMWEREGSHESWDRVTGRPPVSNNGGVVSLEGAETIATITYSPESDEVVVESHISEPLQGQNSSLPAGNPPNSL
jgi:hypothetical protein